MKVIIKKDYDEVSYAAFEVMKEVVTAKEDAVLGLATGSSPIGLYQNMIKDHKENGTSYAKCQSFNLDEYVGIDRNHSQSYWTFMHENLFDSIDVPEENINIPSGDCDDVNSECIRYENELKKHTIDLQILGIGSDGHIGFNEPGTPFDCETHIAELAEQTRKDNARFFEDDISLVPTHAITMGLSSIMQAKKIVVIATGANKADAVFGRVKGPRSEECPASILQDHPDVTVIADNEAASRIR